MADLDLLRGHLRSLGHVVLGYSGGVDSALLAVAGTQALGPEGFLAVIGRSASYPEAQWRTAREVAERFDVPLLEVETRELDDPAYLENGTDRCYFCKSELWTRLGMVARARGAAIIDGTNADDLGEHRPGTSAGVEHEVHSPLVELGWGKAEVRSASRRLGLPTWDAPAAPCLSSRVRYGLAITPARLRQVEEGEAYLRDLGVTGDLRVRHFDRVARIEVGAAQQPRVRERWAEVEERFGALGFDRVELDPEGYRRGRLLALVPPATD
jgi:pyridinium-3,5-biscarboxylic acid mononucleotide sulfurtransferase